MSEPSTTADGAPTPRAALLDARPATEPAGSFSLTAPITLQDRIAASLFSYADMFSAARRRALHILAWVLLVLLGMLGFSSWRDSGKQGFGAFLSRFFHDLFGLDGLPILILAIPILIYYFRHPAIVRGRLARWCRDEGLDQTIHPVYRFEPGGLAVTLPGRKTVMACSRIQGIAETPRHLFIQLRNIEDVYALPRQALSDEQVARIKAWAASCHAGAPDAAQRPPQAQAPEAAPPLLTTRFLLNQDDRAAAISWQIERPGMQRRRRRGFLLAFVLTALLMPLIFVLLWLLDPERVPFRYALPLFGEMFTDSFWKTTLGFWAILAAIILLHPWSRRRHAYKLAGQMHRRMPAEEHEARLYDDRLEVWQEGWVNSFATADFDRIERQGKHLILLRREGEPLILPQRALDAEQLALFERTLTGGAGGDHRQRGGTP
ncbi:YcxB family protein [Achromobacter xylosoxidans]|uniref:YcxB family protein n=1 Tax=Alcaligenes xylosoxydans xylosoxydans TaxID=85698 RepID=UPI00234BDA6D|nr:YcxB family protein [Achromobacter xylosoxidans]MDC6161716.1 YcxB family protein [Achromobacter xylosoxidans]